MDASEESRESSLKRLEAAMAAIVARVGDSSASDEVIRVVAERAEELAAAMSSTTSDALWGHSRGSANQADGMFVIGLCLADPMTAATVTAVGDSARGTLVLGREFAGPDGAVHGGHVARVLDEISAVAQSVATGPRTLTRDLRIRYHALTPLDTLLTVEATVTAVSGRHITVRATVSAGDLLCAESEAVFVKQ
jgi:acyl-coenzyme A thioesterase PaaI-like protein